MSENSVLIPPHLLPEESRFMYRIFTHLIKSFKWEGVLYDMFIKSRKEDKIFYDFDNIKDLLIRTKPKNYITRLGFFDSTYRRKENEAIMVFINGVMRIMNELVEGHRGEHRYNIDTKQLFLQVLDSFDGDLFSFIELVAKNKNGVGKKLIDAIFNPCYDYLE